MLTDEQLAFYQEAIYVLAPQMFSPEEAAALPVPTPWPSACRASATSTPPGAAPGTRAAGAA